MRLYKETGRRIGDSFHIISDKEIIEKKMYVLKFFHLLERFEEELIDPESIANFNRCRIIAFFTIFYNPTIETPQFESAEMDKYEEKLKRSAFAIQGEYSKTLKKDAVLLSTLLDKGYVKWHLYKIITSNEFAYENATLFNHIFQIFDFDKRRKLQQKILELLDSKQFIKEIKNLYFEEIERALQNNIRSTLISDISIIIAKHIMDEYEKNGEYKLLHLDNFANYIFHINDLLFKYIPELSKTSRLIDSFYWSKEAEDNYMSIVNEISSATLFSPTFFEYSIENIPEAIKFFRTFPDEQIKESFKKRLNNKGNIELTPIQMKQIIAYIINIMVTNNRLLEDDLKHNTEIELIRKELQKYKRKLNGFLDIEYENEIYFDDE